MDIDSYIKSSNAELVQAYKELGGSIYWKTRYGDDIRVEEMAKDHIEDVLKMLYDKDPNSYWVEIFENQLRH